MENATVDNPANAPGDVLRVLLVEDELLIAMELEAFLLAEGYVVVGPASSVAESLALISRYPVDFAILDINLNGEPSIRVAEDLVRRAVPFMVLTGYGNPQLPDTIPRDVTTFTKPFDERALAPLLRRLQQERRGIVDTTS